LFQVITSQKARRIIELLLIFRENPVPAEYYDIKKLKGYTDTYRARIGMLFHFISLLRKGVIGVIG
jgi:mRNA-degrading endonuclease RelE of RelBE toxin-antitoxin system